MLNPLFILYSQGTYSEWRGVWYLMSAVFLSASIVFFIFGQAKLQPWAATAPGDFESKRELGNQSTEMSSAPVILELVVPPSDSDSSSVASSQEIRAAQSQSHVDTPKPRDFRLERANFKMERDNLAFEVDAPQAARNSKTKKVVLGFEENSSKNVPSSKTARNNLAFEENFSAPKIGHGGRESTLTQTPSQESWLPESDKLPKPLKDSPQTKPVNITASRPCGARVDSLEQKDSVDPCDESWVKGGCEVESTKL